MSATRQPKEGFDWGRVQKAAPRTGACAANGPKP